MALAREQKPSVSLLGTALIPGLLSGTLVIIMSVSFAALIFGGELSHFLHAGITLAVSCSVIVGLATALFSHCQPVIAMADEDTAPIFALLAGIVVTALPADSSSQVVYSTVVGAIIFSTVLTGAGLALFGIMRVGGFIQFLPHSVMGGYFSAVGWLLLVGGFGVSLPQAPQLWQNNALFALPSLLQWLPAVAMALWLLLMHNRINRKYLLPASFVGGLVIWYLLAATFGISPSDAMAENYLVGPFQAQNQGLFKPLGGISIAQIDWLPLLNNLGSSASIFLISVLSIMLTINGLGYLNKLDPDTNKELLLAGLANMSSGALGGMTGLPSYSISSLAVDSGAAGNRWTGLISVAVCLAIYLWGMDIIAYLPTSILGAILMYLGLNLLHEWLILGWKKFSRLEYLVVPIILLVSIGAGFMPGILIGLVSAIILFVVKYSRTSAVRYIATGEEIMSNVDRNSAEQEFLRAQGKKLMIVALQGYLFFGTSGSLYKETQKRISQEQEKSLKFLIMDFALVSGLDASAALNFQKMSHFATGNNFVLLFCSLSDELRATLNTDEFPLLRDETIKLHRDLDRALEWCEQETLKASPDAHALNGCFDQLASFLSSMEIDILMTYLERREVERGQVLTEQDEHANELYFLETCAASAYLNTNTGELKRVRRSERGTVFGELSFYLDVPRTASVIIDDPGLMYVLNRKQLLRMEENNPTVAAGLSRYMAMLLSERLMFTTKTLRAVSI